MSGRQGKSTSGGQTSRFKVREREVEYRRLRGEASCAECRRCKLKCDKKVPCSSCLRRGCQSICPNGSLSNGTGTRFAFASTEKMQKKMRDMSQRIRQLEDAVQILTASTSMHPHPLLSEEYLSIKSCNYDGIENEKEEEEEIGEPVELTDAFGTLAITDKGEVRFMGRVSSEALLMSADPKAGDPTPDLPSEILHTSDMFPFSPAHLPRAEILQMCEARLPSYVRATVLCEAYLVHVAWFSRLLSREQIIDELLPAVYRLPEHGTIREPPNQLTGGDFEDTVYVHRLALLFAVLACGAAADLAMPVQNDEAALYEQLARTAISLRSVFEGTSLESVQTIILIASYKFYSCRTLTFEPAWKTLIFGMTLGVSIGLHRDPSRWTMDPKIRERRRMVFWELFATDKWKSLESGRPSIFNLAESDCEFPADTEAGVGPDGTFRPSYWRWKHMFSKEVMGPVAEFMALAKPVRYSEILELDRKIREFNARPIPIDFLAATSDMGSLIRRSTLGLYREIALLSLHRNFFARAMLDDPAKALNGPFSPSVLAAYACSISLLKLMRTHYVLQSPLLMRQWMIWIHALIAAVIVGTVAVKKKTVNAVLVAQKELESAIELFEYARTHPVARGGIIILHRLLEKSRYRSQFLTRIGEAGFHSNQPTEALYDAEGRPIDIDEELRILGGGARTVNLVSSSKITSATVVSLAAALQAHVEESSPSDSGSGSGPSLSLGESSPAASSSSHATPPTPAQQPALTVPQLPKQQQQQQPQQQRKPKNDKRSSGLFAVDSSEQSVFCPPPRPRGAYDVVGAGGIAPPEVVAERGAAATDALMASEYDLLMHNMTTNNFGIGTGADAMAIPPETPLEAFVYPRPALNSGLPITVSFQGGELPQVPPLSDPLTMFGGYFPEEQLPPALTMLYGIDNNKVNNIGGPNGIGASVASTDLDAFFGLETLEAGNNNFDFLMDDVLSTTNTNTLWSSIPNNTGSNIPVTQENGQGMSSGNTGNLNGGVPLDTWHSLMEDTQKQQAAMRQAMSNTPQTLF